MCGQNTLKWLSKIRGPFLFFKDPFNKAAEGKKARKEKKKSKKNRGSQDESTSRD